MASIGRGLRSRCGLQRPPPPPPPPPRNPPADVCSDQGRSSDPYRLYHGLHRGFCSLVGEQRSAVPQGRNSCSSELENGEEVCKSKRTSGIASLSSLFSRPSASRIPEFDGKAAGVKPEGMGIRRCFAERQRRTRSTRSEDRGSSVEIHCTGEVLVEMDLLVRRLNEEGYLKSMSFSQGLDPQRVPVNGFVRGALMTAAQRFGEDHQEIAKWLSGSSLKKVALSGCPCTERKTVFAAKRLRSFFCIQEDVICRGCPMKNSCKFVNQSVSREHKLALADAMRVLTAYACGYGAPQALKSQELCHAVGRSLKEVISLSA